MGKVAHAKPPELPKWGSPYPDPAILRAEVEAMVAAIRDALLASVPGEAFERFYFKGSANKPWDTPVDYVAELSDVDIHFVFKRRADADRYFATAEAGFAFQRQVEQGFARRAPKPRHVPRAQIICVNKIVEKFPFVPSPREGIRVLHGSPYPEPDYADADAIRRIDRANLVEHEGFVRDFPGRVMDVTGRYLFQVLRDLAWKVAPTVPRMLHVMGRSTHEAWHANRTALVGMLAAEGRADCARDYAGFYMSAWRFFLSGYTDADAAREAAACGLRVIECGIAVGKKAAGNSL